MMLNIFAVIGATATACFIVCGSKVRKSSYFLNQQLLFNRHKNIAGVFPVRLFISVELYDIQIFIISVLFSSVIPERNLYYSMSPILSIVWVSASYIKAFSLFQVHCLLISISNKTLHRNTRHQIQSKSS